MPAETVLHGARVVTGDSLLDPGWVAVRGDDSLERLLTDIQTEKLLMLCALATDAATERVSEIGELMRLDVTELDRAKMRVLLTEIAIAASDAPAARRHARELVHDPTFGLWSECVIERMNRIPSNE